MTESSAAEAAAPVPSTAPIPRPADARSPGRWHPLWQLVLARLKEFYREPEAVFWVYGFPILMTVGLGVAFRNKPVERITVDIERGPTANTTLEALKADPRFVAAVHEADDCRLRLRTGRTDLIVSPAPGPTPRYDYSFDATRPESLLARNAVDDALERAAGRRDVASTSDHPLDEPGGRYIDFLVPGLLGMSLMGGGLWGVGYVIVDMRLRKLLKRFLATPLRRTDFLLGIMISRMVFMIPEVLIILLFARLAFGVVIYGSLPSLIFLIFLGAVSFAGIGLLVASRARTLEAVSGLMNLVMLPMWLLSGVFFSSDRFPEAVQPAIKALPLTLLNDSLRSVMLEGATLASQWPQIAGLAVWGAVAFVLALRWFRWIT
ncbi:MAG TPA: ABC transporter permease [Pirellulales bacterium]|nr:ABC transporter permease [Pirellulales bacterium]